MAMGTTDQLLDIKGKLQKGEAVPQLSVRDFLSWFGVQRRSGGIVAKIREALNEAAVQTEPDFESTYIDSPIGFILVSSANVKESLGGKPDDGKFYSANTSSYIVSDPTYRISKLEAANRPPTAIHPDAELNQAVTLMALKDFSQLPVMQNEREVKGIISWALIAKRFAFGKTGQYVREFMEPHREIELDASLFQAIPIISESHYVLVRAKDRRISGIVTSTDISLQFEFLSEPFLLLGEIENHIRRIISRKISIEELKGAKDPNDNGRIIESVADLTFGEYIRLIENEDRWKKIALPIDRAEFCRQLEQTRKIRNDVMHFDPDGVLPEDKKILRDFAAFLRQLQALDVS